MGLPFPGPVRVLGLCVVAAAAALGAALLMQYAGGLPPCPLCIQQRWGFAVAGGIALAGMGAVRAGASPRAALALTGLAFLATFALAFRHVGVEQGWWQVPASCLVTGADAETVEELREALLATPPARCDEVPARFLGISIAGWSALYALALAGFAGLAFLRARGGAR